MTFDFIEKLRQIDFPDLRVPNVFIVMPGRGDGNSGSGSGSGSDQNSKSTQLPQINNPPALILDTSAIIDGRIADIATTGFVGGTLVVPSCVLHELQQIADSNNGLKRNRGRRGLEILEELKDNESPELVIAECSSGKDEEIDVAVLNFAKDLDGKVMTTDYNLNKVAKVSGVPILNVNELANMVKTVVLPGEELSIKIIQEGKEDGQGVGYLPDGTMVVVEDGARMVGEEVEVEVKRLLQTDAGRMIFGKLIS